MDLFAKVLELKEKFKSLFIQRKKIKALTNYAECGNFRHDNYLGLVKRCMDEGFLEQEEASFLDHMLKKYELKFLDWSHKTKWLKAEMKRVSNESFKSKPIQGMLFDMSKLDQAIFGTVSIDTLIAAENQKQQGLRQ